jgi:hypothetical protein
MARTQKTAGIKDVFALANKVAIDAQKVDVYEEEGQLVPEELATRLTREEVELDLMVAELLQSEENLKESLFDSGLLNEKNSNELEWSYRKAVAIREVGEKYSRLFFIPFIYHRPSNRKGEQEVDFSVKTRGGQDNREALAEMILSFVANRMSDGSKLYGHPLSELSATIGEPQREWYLGCDEEKHLPSLHKQVLDGSAASLDHLFIGHAQKKRMAAEGQFDDQAGGWTLGVLPFVVEHPSEEFLADIDFRMVAEEFHEDFEQMFDPESKLNYFSPIDPHTGDEEGQMRVWEKLLFNGIEEGLRLLNRKDRAMVIDAFFDIEPDGLIDHVSIQIKVGVDDGELDNIDSLMFFRRLDRHGIGDERGSDLASLLMEMASLNRPDVRLLFTRQLVGSGPLGGDGLSENDSPLGGSDEGDLDE